MSDKVVCIKEGQWAHFRDKSLSGVGPIYGEICVIRAIRPPGVYRVWTDLKSTKSEVANLPATYYKLVGHQGWFLSEWFRPFDEVDQLQELARTVPAEPVSTEC